MAVSPHFLVSVFTMSLRFADLAFSPVYRPLLLRVPPFFSVMSRRLCVVQSLKILVFTLLPSPSPGDTVDLQESHPVHSWCISLTAGTSELVLV